MRPAPIVLLLYLWFGTTCFAANNFIWIESETPTAHSGIKEFKAWGHEYFSGNWLNLSVDADKIESEIQGEFISLKYDFNVSESRKHEIWNRIGFEYARSAFDWRIDDGPWNTAKPDDLTIDLMEVGFWCEIAWLKLGEIELRSGKHTLEIRLNKTKKQDGKFDRILYASDCVCIYPGKFEPYSKYKPNEDHRTEKDREAAEYMFHDYKLDGVWEICRDDELLPEPVTEPISRLPNTTRWSAIQVPGDKNTLRPDLQFAHRVWYRTRVMVNDGAVSGYIEFPQNNLNTTVYVNGKLCGFNKNPFAKFHIDISNAMKPGINVIHVGIRDAWYGFTENPDDPMKLRKRFNLPKKYFSDGFQDLVYPIWNHPQSGILQTPTLGFSSVAVYVDDVFVKPSVAKKRLDVEITLKNAGDEDKTVQLAPKVYPMVPVLKQVSRLGDDTFKEVISDADFHGYTWRETDKIPWKEIYPANPKSKPWIEAVRGDEEGSKPSKEFMAEKVLIKGKSELVIKFSEPWEDAKLWTPQKPFLYFFTCDMPGDNWPTTYENVVFGFREWSVNGKDFMLNGLPFHGWADCFEQPSPESWLKFYRDTNQTVMRFWGTTWKGMKPNDALKFFDENGVVVRRSGIFDGEAIGYNAIETDPVLRAKNKAIDPTREEIKMDLFQNWRDQMVAQVKGERNHPSVMLWSIENEILYINCVNLYGGLMDQFEDEIIKTARAVKEIDPTRTSMVDGGGATKRGNPGEKPGDGLEVHGDHYVVSDFTKYPDLAYEPNLKGGGHGNRWIWDENRPRFIGEDFYVNGFKPEDFAVFGGEDAFSGRTAAKKGVGILYKILTEGYRWNGYGAWQFWVDQNRAENQYTSNAPIAVFCKEYDWTFEAGEKVKRTLRIFNDTMRDEKITLTCELTSAPAMMPQQPGEVVRKTDSKVFSIAAGKSVEFPYTFTAPILPPTKGFDSQGKAELALVLTVNDREVFRDVKEISLKNVPLLYLSMGSSPPQPSQPSQPSQPTVPGVVGPAISSGAYGKFSLLVYDPNSSLEPFWEKYVEFVHKSIDSLDEIPQGQHGKTILLVGKNAIRPETSDSTALRSFAAQGNSVIVLEQQHPLRYGALGCEMETSQNEGRTAFIENESHPIFGNLSDKDFFTWPDGHVVYRDAYMKPVHGARSLLQCGNRLENTGISEIPIGNGVMVLSQLLIGEKIEKSIVARQLLGNMIQYAADYRLNYTPVIVCTDGLDKNLLAELDAMQLKYKTTNDISELLKNTGTLLSGQQSSTYEEAVYLTPKTVLIVSATPKNLKSLVESNEEIEAFTKTGGTILLHGLTPDGLEQYNKLVGIDHIIREFRREKVAFPAKKHHLMQGLSLADISMSSGQKIFGWANDEFVASDTYSYVVDYEDVAPFATFKDDFQTMMTNGMVSADGWPYIVNLPAPDSPPMDLPLKFPKEFELSEVIWTGNTFYYPVTQFKLFFDGKTDADAIFDVEPTNEPQSFEILPGIRGKDLTLRLSQWIVLPDKGKVSGLDNIILKAKRSPEFYEKTQPLLNIGSMMFYPKQAGAIVLCNLKFQENEAVALNAIKKRSIFATILRNLGAEFSETGQIVPGSGLKYTQLDISKLCNAYRNEKGWFGDAKFTFAAMQSGFGRYASVPFEIYDFPTSPVPNCMIVSGDTKIEGIPVGKKADAMFFLQTAKIDRRRNRDEIRDGKEFEIAKYVIHYENGESVELPIMSEIDVENYRRENVEPIPGASLGWVRKYEGTNESAVAYVKQWTPTKPDQAIKSIDFVPGKDRVGSAVLLGITVAEK